MWGVEGSAGGGGGGGGGSIVSILVCLRGGHGSSLTQNDHDRCLT